MDIDRDQNSIYNILNKDQSLTKNEMSELENRISSSAISDILPLISDKSLPSLYRRLNREEIANVEDVICALFKKLNQCTFSTLETFYTYIFEQDILWMKQFALNNLKDLLLNKDKDNFLYQHINMLITIMNILKENDAGLANLCLNLIKNLICEKSTTEEINNIMLSEPILTTIIQLAHNKDTIKLRAFEVICVIASKNPTVFKMCHDKGLLDPMVSYLPGCGTSESQNDPMTQSGVSEVLGQFLINTETGSDFLKLLEDNGSLDRMQSTLFSNCLLPIDSDTDDFKGFSEVGICKLNIRGDGQVGMELEDSDELKDLVQYFLFPSTLKFFGLLLSRFPHYIVKLRKVVQGVVLQLASYAVKIPTASDSHSLIVAGACLDFLATVSQCPCTKVVLDKIAHFPRALQTITQSIMGEAGSGQLMVRALETLSSLIYVQTDTMTGKECTTEEKNERDACAGITLRWYKMALWMGAGNDPDTFVSTVEDRSLITSSPSPASALDPASFTNRLIDVVRSPFEDERAAVYALWLSVVKTLPWGPTQLLLQGPALLLNYLLSRGGLVEISNNVSSPTNTKPTVRLTVPRLSKADKEAKYAILQEVAGQPGFYSRFPGPVAIAIKKFVKEGPFYTEVVAQSQVAATESWS